MDPPRPPRLFAPDRLPTRPDLPAVPPKSEGHRDSTSPPKWEIDRTLAIVKEALETQEALRETVDELSTNLERERKRAEDLEDRLERFRRQSRDDDDARDRKIQTLADRVEELNRPRTEATATTAAATTINAARKSDRIEKVLYAVAIIIVYVLTLLGVRLPKTEPNVSIPVPTVKPAEPGFQH